LTDEVAALLPATLAEAPAMLGDQVRDRIAAARTIAQDAPHSWKTLRNWWTGNAVETAWNHLQTAREDMLLIAPTADVRAQMPALQRRLATISPDPAHDPQLETLKRITATTGDLSLDQRGEIRAAHEHVRAVADNHSEARSFRNNLILWTAGLVIGSVVLASVEEHRKASATW
jgi:hypothetical protein